MAHGDERDIALAQELRLVGRNTNPTDALAARIESAVGSENATVDIDDAYELEVLARALDHRRNASADTIETPADERDFPRAHVDIRDDLIRRLGYVPLTYKLSGLDDPPAEFWSYTGTYTDTDRIVTADGRAWRATRVVAGGRNEPGQIDVEPWRDHR